MLATSVSGCACSCRGSGPPKRDPQAVALLGTRSAADRSSAARVRSSRDRCVLCFQSWLGRPRKKHRAIMDSPPLTLLTACEHEFSCDSDSTWTSRQLPAFRRVRPIGRQAATFRSTLSGVPRSEARAQRDQRRSTSLPRRARPHARWNRRRKESRRARSGSAPDCAPAQLRKSAIASPPSRRNVVHGHRLASPRGAWSATSVAARRP